MFFFIDRQHLNPFHLHPTSCPFHLPTPSFPPSPLLHLFPPTPSTPPPPITGFKYGIEEVDCCGCKVTKCIDCPAPNNDTVTCATDKPRDCYNYIKNSIHVAKTECYQSTCPEKKSDAAPPEVSN